MNIEVFDNGGTRKARYIIRIPDKGILIESGKTPEDYWRRENYQMQILTDEWKQIPLFNLSLDIRQMIFKELSKEEVLV